MYLAILLDAGHDINGNPQRVYVVHDDVSGDIVKAFDQGYAGERGLRRAVCDYDWAEKLIIGPTYKTTQEEYDNLINLGEWL